MTDEEIRKNNQEWYKKTYNNLIEKCKQMESDGELTGIYTETHHILPKCIGGTDESTNLVKLPARYHIIAHLLLIKIYPEQIGLVYAAHMMLCASNNGLRKSAQDKISTRTYASVREEYSRILKNRKASEETRRKMSASRTGTKRTEVQKEHMSRVKSGKNHNFYGKHHKDSTKKLMSSAQSGEKNHFYGKHHSEESLRRILFTKSHYVIAPDGTVYETISKAAKAAVMSRDKLSHWLYSDNQHGYRFLDKDWYKKGK